MTDSQNSVYVVQRTGPFLLLQIPKDFAISEDGPGNGKRLDEPERRNEFSFSSHDIQCDVLVDQGRTPHRQCTQFGFSLDQEYSTTEKEPPCCYVCPEQIPEFDKIALVYLLSIQIAVLVALPDLQRLADGVSFLERKARNTLDQVRRHEGWAVCVHQELTALAFRLVSEGLYFI